MLANKDIKIGDFLEMNRGNGNALDKPIYIVIDMCDAFGQIPFENVFGEKSMTTAKYDMVKLRKVSGQLTDKKSTLNGYDGDFYWRTEIFKKVERV